MKRKKELETGRFGARQVVDHREAVEEVDRLRGQFGGIDARAPVLEKSPRALFA